MRKSAGQVLDAEFPIIYEDGFKDGDNYDFLLIDDPFNLSKIRGFSTFADDICPPCLRQSVGKTIAILHDFAPLRFAGHYFREQNRDMFQYILHLEWVSNMDGFLAVSENTKNDGMYYLKRKSDDFATIFEGVDRDKFSAPPAKYSFGERDNTIVCVGDSEPRKNVQGLIRGFGSAMSDGRIPKDSRLYICCRMSKGFGAYLKDVIAQSRLTDRQIVLTGYIPDSDMAALVRKAKASVFPSFYEGFGLPIIESYALGTPCFAADASSMKELALPECLFDPYSRESIASSVASALTDAKLCKRSLDFGTRLLAGKCNWPMVADRVFSAIGQFSKTKHRSIKNGDAALCS
jgi:glycosyltransferase involved in cell wall biosynthesis